MNTETAPKADTTEGAASALSAGLGMTCPFCGLSRAEWHDKAWALYNAKTFDDTMLSKVSVHTIRAVFDATYDALMMPNE